jgi:hypothetical protein
MVVVVVVGCSSDHEHTADGKPGIDAPTVNVELQVTGAPELTSHPCAGSAPIGPNPILLEP